MAVDSWMPHRFSARSDRLTTQNGILLMCGAALGALIYTHGNVSAIVVMYSINVFLTFSLSMLGMLQHWLCRRAEEQWRRQAALFAVCLLLCVSILTVTVLEKLTEGGWMTVVVTGALVGLAFIVRQHYGTVYAKISELYQEDMLELAHVPADGEEEAIGPLDSSQPTAILLVSSYSGLGIHTMLSIFRMFPGYYKNLLFVTVGVVDSGVFKGEETVDALQEETEKMLARYLRLAKRLRIPCECDYELGTDAVDEAEKLCRRLHREFPKAT